MKFSVPVNVTPLKAREFPRPLYVLKASSSIGLIQYRNHNKRIGAMMNGAYFVQAASGSFGERLLDMTKSTANSSIITTTHTSPVHSILLTFWFHTARVILSSNILVALKRPGFLAPIRKIPRKCLRVLGISQRAQTAPGRPH